MGWQCANDKADSVKIDAPTGDTVKLEATKHFAKGSAQAILAKGGPQGVFIWAHLHAIYNGQDEGKAHYTIRVKVKDKGGSNWEYFTTPILECEVNGVFTKPERHRHCYIQIAPPAGEVADNLKAILDNPGNFEIEVSGDRERESLGDYISRTIKDNSPELIDLFTRYAAGEQVVEAILNIINEGKTRPQ